MESSPCQALKITVPRIHWWEMSTSNQPQETSAHRSSPRVLRACDRCRSRKVRCDGNSPCAGCRPGGHACFFRPPRQTRQKRQHTQRLPSTSAQISLPESSPVISSRSTARALHDPVQFKRQMELRAGIGVTNVDTGSFQFYGKLSVLVVPFAFDLDYRELSGYRTFISFLFRPTHVSEDGTKNK